jgi:hypothetical protein
MTEKCDEWDGRVRRLLAEGEDLLNKDGFEEALSRFCAAWELLPEPRTDQPIALEILAAIGDTHFFKADFAAGRAALMTAMQCSHGEPIGNPFLRMRLGECFYELGDLKEAANWLAGAYLLEGKVLFSEEDPKYLEFIKSQLEPPPGGWPEGW